MKACTNELLPSSLLHVTPTVCPDLPCPFDPAFDVTFEVEEGGGSTIVAIIAIIVIIPIIIVVIVILAKREWRERCFRKMGPKKNRSQVLYVDLDGNNKRSPPASRRDPPIKTQVPYRQEDDNELNLNAQLAPDIPGVLEFEPEFKEPELQSRPKRRPKEKTSLKESFTDIDKYNAFNDKGRKDDENLVEINVEELLEQQKDAMRKELKKHKETIRSKDQNGKKRPASRQRLLSGSDNISFTNDYVDVGPQTVPETLDNVLNEMQSRKQTPEPGMVNHEVDTTAVHAKERRRKHHSGHSDRSKRSHEGRESRSSKGDREKRYPGEKREHRRRKNGYSGDSMRSTESGKSSRSTRSAESGKSSRSNRSTESGKSSRSKSRHSKSSRNTSPDPKAILMTDITLNEFTSLEPIDELSGSLV